MILSSFHVLLLNKKIFGGLYKIKPKFIKWSKKFLGWDCKVPTENWAGTARFYLIFGLGLHIIYIYLRVVSSVACILPKIGRAQLNSTPAVRELLKDDTSSLTNEWRIKILEANPNGA